MGQVLHGSAHTTEAIRYPGNGGPLYLFVAIDRTSRFSYADLHPWAARIVAWDLPCSLIAPVPCIIQTILTNNGIRFARRRGTGSCWSILFDRIGQASVMLWP